jgi:hypothetical protein
MYHGSITAVCPASIGDRESVVLPPVQGSAYMQHHHPNSVQPFGPRLSEEAGRLREQAKTVPPYQTR